MKVIEITVSPSGQTHLETRGFTGAECREASRALEQALGLIASEEPTSEMYAQASDSVALKVNSDCES